MASGRASAVSDFVTSYSSAKPEEEFEERSSVPRQTHSRLSSRPWSKYHATLSSNSTNANN